MAEQKRSRKNIPVELVEKIVLNLPIKSVVRFSLVSRSWKLMIFRAEFAKVYRGREMIVLRGYSNDDHKSLVCSLSSLLADENPIDKASAFVRPSDSYLDASSCRELWCLEFENSLCLYNPTMQTYRKLPIPSSAVPIGSKITGTSISVFVYGLGYDYVGNDYKILKIHKSFYVETELYSLTLDSWRKVESSPPDHMHIVNFISRGLFANGTLHWLVRCIRMTSDPNHSFYKRILSFDLSTEKYGELKLPELIERGRWGCSVVGGKLCVHLNRRHRFLVWVMEDYGWTKVLEIDYARIHPLCYSYLKPCFCYDRDGNLIKAVVSSVDMRNIFIYKDDESSPQVVEKNFGSNGYGIFDTSLTYVESFVSPWPGLV